MTGEWTHYWRASDGRLEAMHAHFERHVYHRHSHETYSFGVTEQGAQAFDCRGGRHVSAAGMIMTFNPDDPHDGHAVDDLGFTYRMVHIAPDVVADVLADRTERPPSLPLFRDPVAADPRLAQTLRTLHAALLGAEPALRRDELLADAVALVARHAGQIAGARARLARRDAARIAARARDLLHVAYADDLSADDLAAVTGRSRYAVYRAFQATYGLAPSDYQRQLRLRTARALLAQGRPVAAVAADVGFADQSHLTRWFARYFGITPGAYQRAVR